MNKRKSIFKRIKYKPLLQDAFYALTILFSIIFLILWQNSKREIKIAGKKIAKLQQDHKETQESLTKKTVIHNKNHEESFNVIKTNLHKNEQKVIRLKREIAAFKQQQNQAVKRWRDPLIASLDISQDIYTMKWKSNNQSLSDMKNHSARVMDICKKWEELCEKLAPNPELAPQVAKLRIRIAQTYSGMGIESKIDLSKIDWKTAQLEAQKPEIEARIWFNIASYFAENGKLKKAQEYLDKAKSVIPQMEVTPEKATYFSAMMNLLTADITATTNPKESLEFYIQACDDLAKVVTAFPNNTKLRTAFIQACLNGAMLSEGGTSAGQAEEFKKRAFKNINTLLTDNPKMEKPHLLFAEVKILEAEEMLRQGEHLKASKLLNLAKTHIKEGGGSVVLTAEVEASQAFIYWDQGKRTKAMSIINEAIANVTQLKKNKPDNAKIVEANFRLASLYWVRSSMQLTPTNSISDGLKAAKYLVELVQNGAGKREASSRRMIAIIYGDIGHQAYSSNQKAIAKNYFQEAKKQWTYLIKNWGECDEYKEGERWCNWRMKRL